LPPGFVNGRFEGATRVLPTRQQLHCRARFHLRVVCKSGPICYSHPSMHDRQTPPPRPHGILVAPSILSADFGALADAVRSVGSMGGDWVHLDVMDGCFVPNITFGPKAVMDLRPVSALPFDVHLMVCRPESHVERFCEAGADFVTVHLEAATHLDRILGLIRERGKRPGVAIVPSTPAAALSEILHLVDLVLVMTVNPGFGGQEIIRRCLTKVTAVTRMREEAGLDFLIEVDGGINRDTVADAIAAGAQVLVAGSAVFGASDPSREVAFLRQPW
jgi:ribulose-phosphate 3-epimerase